MSLRVCAEPGCGRLVVQGRCDEHRKAQRAAEDARRPSSTQRGYGAAHEALRARWAAHMARGHVVICAKCGGWIDPSLPWDLGHVEGDRSRYSGPQHVLCNRGRDRRGPRSKRRS